MDRQEDIKNVSVGILLTSQLKEPDLKTYEYLKLFGVLSYSTYYL